MKPKELQSEAPLDIGKEDSQTLHRLCYSRNGSCIKMIIPSKVVRDFFSFSTQKKKKAYIQKSQNERLVMTRNGFPGERNCDNVERNSVSAKTFCVSIFIGHVGEC